MEALGSQEEWKKQTLSTQGAVHVPDAPVRGQREAFFKTRRKDPFSRLDLQRRAETRLFVVILILLSLVVTLVALISIFKVFFFLGPAVAALGVIARLGKAYIAIFH